MIILQKKQLKKYYGTGETTVKALDNVSLEIEEGSFSAIVGTSGSGKSTLLHMLGGLDRPTSGSVMVDGKNIIELDGHAVDKKYVSRIIDILGLKSKLYSLPSQLSGGQQQRVAIARALASKPAIILADEPTGNLDSKTSLDVLGLLKITSEHFHQTIVMITHNEEIAQMADRIIHIEDGQITGGGHYA